MTEPTELTQHIITPVSRYVLQDSNHIHLRLDKRWNQKWNKNKNRIWEDGLCLS
ncbi:hypothetical protein BCR33DRAFT_722802 [Rhizoclosmatium globosum]|uniref:Uncharacterized protein n=1 Tax=Rhizoclosmatium globosum TaxID=329046 RepID=A0A1Y2BIN0_9FUNG|nr:hypothetical protein BCR33DRAFT_722802 [Rhizoclosmatium globosum]|eukprot:ORY34407.1 hypothetical protein BCR33DRAFT_722802 [Rhizoclosmatium globosum]